MDRAPCMAVTEALYFNRRLLLVVADSYEKRQALRNRLAGHYRIAEAADVFKAVNMCVSLSPKAIVTDVQPGFAKRLECELVRCLGDARPPVVRRGDAIEHLIDRCDRVTEPSPPPDGVSGVHSDPDIPAFPAPPSGPSIFRRH